MKIPIKPVILVILDGWGITSQIPGNAIEKARTPYFKSLQKHYPNTTIKASGEAVGLPTGDDGNSEVGHMNIGAGQIVYESIVRINQAIDDGSFFKNRAFLECVKHVTQHNSNMHLLGLVGSGEVHSSFDHLIALLHFCKSKKLTKVFIHVISDGRDSPPHESATLIRVLEEKLQTVGIGKIASVLGRYYAMDRDLHWDRIQKAYDCLTIGSDIAYPSPGEGIQSSYDNGISDEFILPFSITNTNKKPIGLVSDNDGIIFFNSREDRARQLTKAFVMPEFETEKIYRSGESLATSNNRNTFTRNKRVKNLFFSTMIEYEKGLPVSDIAFPAPMIALPLSKVIAKNNLRQFHIAETEKYPHVTYFFNGGREDPFKGEDRVLVPSPMVATYDQKPEMSAEEITDIVIDRLEMGVYNFMIINYANPDMVAHTGNFNATVQAIEVIDSCLKKLIGGILSKGGLAIVTSDHGNAEELIGKTGDIDTQHSRNDVPLLLIEKSLIDSDLKLKSGILADIAPTILYLLGIKKPKEMTGINLIDT